MKFLQLSDCCREQANNVRRDEVSPCVLRFLYRSHGNGSVIFTESQNGRGWKGPLGII